MSARRPDVGILLSSPSLMRVAKVQFSRMPFGYLVTGSAIQGVFPQMQIHTCVLYLVRRSLAFVSYKDRERIASGLRAIYRADTPTAATAALAAFAASPDGQHHPTIAPIWERQWEFVTPTFAYPHPIRRIRWTTNAVESLHMQLRKIIKTPGHFLTDVAALKLLYLALRNIRKRWHASPDWHAAIAHFALLFPERFVPDPRAVKSHDSRRHTQRF